MTEDVATSTDESEFEAMGKSSGSCIRKNAYGQVKTSRNQKRPKLPLPPMKRTPKAPLRRSERNKGKTKEQVSAHIFKIYIQEYEYFCITGNNFTRHR